MLVYSKPIGGCVLDASYYPQRFCLKLISYYVEFPFIFYWQKVDQASLSYY